MFQNLVLIILILNSKHTQTDRQTRIGLSFQLTTEINCWDRYQRDDDNRPRQPPQHLAAALLKVTKRCINTLRDLTTEVGATRHPLSLFNEGYRI